MDQPLLPLSGTPTHPIEPAPEGAPLRGKGGPPSVPDHDLFQRIGAGAYGEVWLARNLATGALRAVKIVYRSTFADERPFNREFEGIKKFDVVSRSHPSQLALFHVGRNDAAEYFYYVMELADPAEPGSSDQYSVGQWSVVRGLLPVVLCQLQGNACQWPGTQSLTTDQSQLTTDYGQLTQRLLTHFSFIQHFIQIHQLICAQG